MKINWKGAWLNVNLILHQSWHGCSDHEQINAYQSNYLTQRTHQLQTDECYVVRVSRCANKKKHLILFSYHLNRKTTVTCLTWLTRSTGLLRRYINITITIPDIIHRPVFYLKLNSVGLSVLHRKHIASPLRAQQVKVIYRFVTTVY
jgi:hypothetical protein